MAESGDAISDESRRLYTRAAQAMHHVGQLHAHGQDSDDVHAHATALVDAVCRTLPAPTAREVRALLDGYYDIAADHSASTSHCQICTTGPSLDTHSTGLTADLDADLDEVADFDTYTRRGQPPRD